MRMRNKLCCASALTRTRSSHVGVLILLTLFVIMSLLATLTSLEALESPAEEESADHVFRDIHDVVKRWIMDVAGINISKHHSSVLQFGSSRLGARLRGHSDLDLVLAVNAGLGISRKDFFNDLVRRFRVHRKVKSLVAVEKAFVPVIKMTFQGLDVDLAFADVFSVKSYNTAVDDVSWRSIKGRVVADKIINMLQSRVNLYNFRLALKAVKLWAWRRGIYGSNVGFLGGISWSILIAFVCLENPQRCSSPEIILAEFFRTFSTWPWPRPVSLERNVSFNRVGVMPILLPTDDTDNCAHSLYRSSAAVIQQELIRGFQVSNVFGKLFEEYTLTAFEAEYADRILVTSSGSEAWHGFVASRLRRLLIALEKTRGVRNVRIWPRPDKSRRDVVVYRIGLGLNRNRSRWSDLERVARNFETTVFQEREISRGSLQVSVLQSSMEFESRKRKRSQNGYNCSKRQRQMY